MSRLAKVCFLDNDITYKLVAFQLFDEAIATLQIEKTEMQVLPTAKFVFQRMQKKQGDNPDLILAQVIDLVRNCIPVNPELDAISTEELILLKQVEGIHEGEAALIVVTRSQADFLLLTGDKNCMQALAAIPESIYKRLCGRVICLEQIVLKLIEVKGFEFVRDRILPMVSCDKSLQICFGYSTPATEESVASGLISYINAIHRNAPSLLADL